MKRYSEAEPLLRGALESRRRVLGVTHPATIRSMNTLAGLLLRTNRKAEAAELLKATYETATRVLGDGNLTTSNTALNLATTHKELGHFDEAERFAIAAAEGRKRSFGETHYRNLVAMKVRAQILLAAGRYSDCADLLSKLHEAMKQTGTESTPLYSVVISGLAFSLVADRRGAEAEPFASELIAFCNDRLPGNAIAIGRAKRLLATCFISQRRFDEATTLLNESLAHLTSALPEYSWYIQYSRAALGAALAGQGKPEEGKGLIVKSRQAIIAAQDQIKIDHRRLVLNQLDEYVAEFAKTD